MSKEFEKTMHELNELCPNLDLDPKPFVCNNNNENAEEEESLELCRKCGFVKKDCQCKNEETKLKLKTKILFGLSWILNKLSLGLQYTFNKVRDAYNYIYSKALEDEILVDRLYKKNTNTTPYQIKNGGRL